VRVRNLYAVVRPVDVATTTTFDGKTSVGGAVHVILHSEFKQLLFINARTMVLLDPTSLFDSEVYQASGLLFWSSVYSSNAMNPMWLLLGESCEGMEQSGDVLVINKELAWSAMNMAVHLRSVWYQNMVNGDNDLFRFAAIATHTPFTVIPNAIPVGAEYLLDGERTYCAHSAVYAMPVTELPMFITNLNAEVLAAGRSVDTIQCYSGVVSFDHDNAMVDAISRLQQTVPEMLVAAPNACSVRLSEMQIEDIMRRQAAKWNILLDQFSIGETRDITISQPDRTKDCGDWFSCGAYQWNTMDLWVKFINISTTARSAQIDVRTKAARNHGLGNDTFIQVINKGRTHMGCDFPVPGSAETHVSLFNMARRSWYIIGVAWGPPKAQFRTIDIILSIRLNGMEDSEHREHHETITPS